MRNVTIRQLQMFAAAADTQSFARAAEQMHVSPAAVSFQIKQIEDMSGFSMFERTGRSVVLTDAGRSLLGYARVILRAVHDADQTLLALQGAGGKVTLGAVSTAKYIVPHVLARFQADHPGVTITLRFGNRQQIADALQAGEVDLAVTGRPLDHADVSATAFATHPTVMIGPRGHRFASSQTLSMADLADDRIISREEGSGTRDLMEQAFVKAGVAPHIAMTTDSNETIKQAVMAGMGIAVISRQTIGLELALKLLCVLPVAGFPVQRTWFVVRRRSMPMMPAHVNLQEFLQKHGQAVIDGLEAGHHLSI